MISKVLFGFYGASIIIKQIFLLNQQVYQRSQPSWCFTAEVSERSLRNTVFTKKVHVRMTIIIVSSLQKIKVCYLSTRIRVQVSKQE